MCRCDFFVCMIMLFLGGWGYNIIMPTFFASKIYEHFCVQFAAKMIPQTQASGVNGNDGMLMSQCVRDLII